MAVGYEYLRQAFSTTSLPLRRPAAVRPVKRIMRDKASVAVPASVAPRSGDPLEHILFALKHEGTNLQILAATLPRIEIDRLRAELRKTPGGAYIRTVCYLWETYSGRTIDDIPEINAPTATLFDPQQYFTIAASRDPKWRVSFNGLGTIRYCATIEKTPGLGAAIENDVLQRAEQFATDNKGALLDRALEWAYLHETQDSFAIEHETPGPDREKRFVGLLHQAHDGAPLTEDYLASLQRAMLSNPLEHASEFRQEQNWLGGAGRGPAAVTYVPPPPGLCRELMAELMAWVNTHATEVPPVLLAAIAKFGFVYLHPFMDGNGRLSRFLFHKALCLSGKMGNGLLLPVSTAMHRHEAEYLAALQSYSRPVRQLWDVRSAGEDVFDFSFNGPDSVYRYWDATDCAEFGAKMADQALEIELVAETEFLGRFDRILREVDRNFDIRSTVLNPLIAAALGNGGTISNNKRKKAAGLVPEDVFPLIETLTREELAKARADTTGLESKPGR